MIPEDFRPLLAATATLKDIELPILVSPKLDGIRALVFDGVMYSRSLKKIRNKYIQERVRAQNILLDTLDGELIVGDPGAKDVFQKTTSAVMSTEGTPDFYYYVFDIPVRHVTFYRRFDSLKRGVFPSWVKVVPHIFCKTIADVKSIEQMNLVRGYEGTMIRSLNGYYKYGRSTVKEGILLKLKPFEDDEATIVDFVEKQHNGNGPQKDERGYTKRSHAKAGLRPTGTLGALVVESERWPKLFQVGTGFDDSLRADIWKNKRHYRGKTIKFKFQRVGTKDLPRQPVFLGFRDSRDL